MNFLNTDDQVATLFQEEGHHDDHHHNHNFQTSFSVGTCSLQPSCFDRLNSKKHIKTSTKWGIQLDHVSPKPSSSFSFSSQLLSFENSISPQYSANKPQHQTTYSGNYLSHDSTLKQKEEAVSQLKNIQFLPNLVIYDSGLENQVVDYQITKPNNDIIGTKRCYSMTRTPPHAQDPIIAERKRREKLTQCFVALSAIIPDLKKVFHSYLFVLMLGH